MLMLGIPAFAGGGPSGEASGGASGAATVNSIPVILTPGNHYEGRIVISPAAAFTEPSKEVFSQELSAGTTPFGSASGEASAELSKGG